MAKFVYPHAAVWSSDGFDFSEFLRDGRPGGYKERRVGGGSLAARKRELRRQVGLEGLSLDDAMRLDFDAWADDLSLLKQLAREHASRPENAPQLGVTRRKASALFLGKTRAGKDTLAACTAVELQRLAALAGLQWSVVRPAGEHASENIGTAELVQHEDVRFQFVRGYDELLRYLDPNRSTHLAARNSNLPPIAPRAILMSSSETLTSLGLSLKARKSSDTLAQSAGDFGPIDIDEFIARLGFVIEVTKPDGIRLHDRERTMREMVVEISRVEMLDEARIDDVKNRGGDLVLGSIRTVHALATVAIIRGCEPAARFLAHEILTRFSPDVATSIPDALSAMEPERESLRQAHHLILEERARDAEAAMTRLAADRYGATYAAHFEAAHLKGSATPDPSVVPFIKDPWRPAFSEACCVATGIPAATWATESAPAFRG